MEVIPAISMALFGHIVDQRKKKRFAFQMYFGFSIISLGFFYLASFIKDFTTQTILYSIYFRVFRRIGAFLEDPTSLLALIVPKKYIKCCHLE
jgi:hypothetical protein